MIKGRVQKPCLQNKKNELFAEFMSFPAKRALLTTFSTIFIRCSHISVRHFATLTLPFLRPALWSLSKAIKIPVLPPPSLKIHKNWTWNRGIISCTSYTYIVKRQSPTKKVTEQFNKCKIITLFILINLTFTMYSVHVASQLKLGHNIRVSALSETKQDNPRIQIFRNPTMTDCGFPTVKALVSCTLESLEPAVD